MPCVGQSLNKAANVAEGMACPPLPEGRSAWLKRRGGRSRRRAVPRVNLSEQSQQQAVGEWQRHRKHAGQRQSANPKAVSNTKLCDDPLIMCGRYRLSRRKQIIEEHFDSVSGEENWSHRYNVAPTQPVPIIRQNPKEPVRQLSLVRWGLIPSWSKDTSGAASMINARSETA